MYLVKEGASFKSVVHSTCEQKFYNNNGFNLNLCYHLSLKSSKGGLPDPVSPFAKWGFWENILHDNLLQECGEAKAINTHDAEVYIWCPVFLQIPGNLLWASHGLDKSWFNACDVQEMFLFCWHSHRFASHLALQDSWLTHRHKWPLQLQRQCVHWKPHPSEGNCFLQQVQPLLPEILYLVCANTATHAGVALLLPIKPHMF